MAHARARTWGKAAARWSYRLFLAVTFAGVLSGFWFVMKAVEMYVHKTSDLLISPRFFVYELLIASGTVCSLLLGKMVAEVFLDEGKD